jgi:hypothetical protein
VMGIKRATLAIALITVALVIPLAAGANEAVTPGEAQTAASGERVGCWNYARFQVGFKKKPRKCVFMRNGGTSYADSIYVTDMKNWTRWGRPTTKVKGINRANMGATARVKIRLSKVRNRCGQRVYTKIKFRYPKYKSGGSFRLYSCKR